MHRRIQKEVTLLFLTHLFVPSHNLEKKSGFAFMKENWWAHIDPSSMNLLGCVFCLWSCWMKRGRSHCYLFVQRHLMITSALNFHPCLVLLNILPWSKTKYFPHCCNCLQLNPAPVNFRHCLCKSWNLGCKDVQDSQGQVVFWQPTLQEQRDPQAEGWTL